MPSLIISMVATSAAETPICTAGTSAIANLVDTSTTPDPAITAAKWDSDGDVYTRIDAAFGAKDSTWIGNCINSDYEGRWSLTTGDAPSNAAGSDGVWHLMTSEVRVRYSTVGIEALGGDFVFELRRVLDEVIILTDSFSMDATESA